MPDYLIDSDTLAAAIPSRERAAEAEEKDSLAAYALRVDRTVERDRETRLHIEAIEFVQHREVFTVRRRRGAVGQRQTDPPAGLLIRIGDGEAVAGKWAFIRCVEIK